MYTHEKKYTNFRVVVACGKRGKNGKGVLCLCLMLSFLKRDKIDSEANKAKY